MKPDNTDYVVITFHHGNNTPPESYVIPPGIGQWDARVECIREFVLAHWDNYKLDKKPSDFAEKFEMAAYFFEYAACDVNTVYIPGYKKSDNTIPEMPY